MATGGGQLRKIVANGIKGYENKRRRCIKEGRRLHSSSIDREGARVSKKLLAKTNWFKKRTKRDKDSKDPQQGGHEVHEAHSRARLREHRVKSVLFVEQSPGGELAKRMRDTGMRGSQPEQEPECEQPTWGRKEPEKEKLLKNNEPANKDLPVPDRDSEQHGLQHHQQQGLGRCGEDHEGAAREGKGSSTTHWLERTANTKRGYEDDFENGEAENSIAPKKVREGFKNMNILGGGGSPCKIQD